MATTDSKKFDDLDITNMSRGTLEETKYMIECELAWIQQDISNSTERLMIDDKLDAFNKFNNLLKEVNFRLNIK